MTFDSPTQRIAVLGSTGSIGTSCLQVVDGLGERVRVHALTARESWEALGRQSQQYAPRWAVLTDPSLRDVIPRDTFGRQTELLFGPEGVERVASDPETDVVVSGIVGAAGLRGTWAAVEAGKRVAIANKETLVVAGPLVMQRAAERGAELLPVDSEHSAIYQALQAGKPSEVRRIILTASGGPFRTWTAEQLESVTPAQALAHPTWNMGKKITIDSATLMNKALEIIEARWLFGLSVEQIAVVIHPQSIVHSMVEFVDGSVVAQLSPPDMKLPIQYALTHPARCDGVSPRMDWTRTMSLDFAPPDLERFPALRLGFEVAERGGTCGAILNAVNEVAVARFLAGELRFIDISRACRQILEAHQFDPRPTLTELFRQDAWAREEMHQWRA
ncbi:MAG TPA: 1-deoxy-D-xylulose-5-phosphate reductoisomerase [Planctomycetaceae bacterium]|nr:1-deoxy-D-xylulose-5-phosphate reductoisomerase [Planctomycetaceae bacterium]